MNPPAMSDAIVLTTDFSECARRAIPHAVRMARATHLPIRLLHVIDIMPRVVIPEHVSHASWQRLSTEQVMTQLEAHAREIREGAPEVDVTTRYHSGDVTHEVLADLADDARALVIATHGRHGMRRFLMGSNTTRLLRRSKVPILVVGEGAEDRPVKRILVPADERLAERGLAEEVAFIKAYQPDEVTVFHGVVPPEVTMLIGGEIGVAISQVTVEEAMAQQREKLEEFQRHLEEAGVNAQLYITHCDRPAAAIKAYADYWKSDLVIMPAHGYRGLTRLALGSVTEEVLRTLRRPVLVLKPNSRPY